MLTFLHSDLFLKLAAFVLAPAAIAVKQIAAPYTVAYHVADYVQQGLLILGVSSTTARVVKPPTRVIP